MSADLLSPRALNRALLQRQGLLARSDRPAAEMIEQLVGMQAQVPSNPYVALWSRLDRFDPTELSGLIAGRQAVRAQLMRATIHLVTARDCLALQPLTQPVLARTFKSQWGKQLGELEVDEVVAAGLELLAERPRTRAELRILLASGWPESDSSVMAYAVAFLNALVQVPPRGLWKASGQATWAPAETWLGSRPDASLSPDSVILRYLGAFGPATVADIRTWSGFTGLREVVARLRTRLRTFRDEAGKELLDVLDAPLPDPETPAPPRFLPEYDNVMLAHAERSRILNGRGPGLPFPRGTWIGTLLVDGFYRANWSVSDDAGEARLIVDRLTRAPGDSAGVVDEIEAEGAGLLALIAPDAARRSVRFAPTPRRRAP